MFPVQAPVKQDVLAVEKTPAAEAAGISKVMELPYSLVMVQTTADFGVV